jgi:KDO2-lipid IV(A) lauroyltransferase
MARVKRPRNRVLDYSVYLAVRLLVACCQALPVGAGYRIADLLARLMYHVDKRHRAVAFENLTHAFGAQYDDAGRDRIVRGVYRHFCRMIIEMLHIPKALSLMTYRRYIKLSGHEKILDRLLDGGPMIMITGHFGNWEMAGYLFGVFGFPPCSVARPIDNPYLDKYLRDFRQQTGQTLITKKGGGDQMVNVLEQGGVLSVLADQDAGPKGLFVDFFGRPASAHKALALLSLQHNAPIAVGGARRLGNKFEYEIVCEDLIDPSEWAEHPDPVRAITQRYTTALERLIRRDPEQYMWLHRRWKHQPRTKTPATQRDAA